MRVAIIGYGKMGHEIEQVLLSRGHSVALIIDQDNAHDLCAEKLAGVDVAIEFTTPTTAYSNVRTCIECGTPVVSGTTGWHDKLEELQALCRERNSSMIWSSNYSLGVNITFRLNRYLAELMNRFDAYNVAIEEIHHTQKKDAPSGTAISLANDILERVERKQKWVNEPTEELDAIEITSLREGTVPGTHTVTYLSEDDKIEIKHTLFSRRALALGAVVAAEFVAPKKGVFTIDDLFD
ncbi:MAG: 4-hydroxy-tetrahydrodipicolinate reductase [Rikenellaceae bacterium]|nr:4-hydroxy-tetrahydrodipicolinate reductase [Rikenellaceae bacterium]